MGVGMRKLFRNSTATPSVCPSLWPQSLFEEFDGVAFVAELKAFVITVADWCVVAVAVNIASLMRRAACEAPGTIKA